MIEVKGLTKFYGDFCALDHVDFTIQDGQIVGLLGLNGAGKSTALKILAGYLLPTSGEVFIGGVDVVAAPEKVRATIGFLPEVPPLYDEMTVGRFLAWLARLRGVPGAQVERRVGHVAEETGLDGRLSQVISTLSLGYRRRLGIAQAIVHDPRLVILDEPISGLDPVQIVQMRSLIRGLKGKHTVVVSSHILSEVQETCDHLLMLRGGKLVAEGTEAEIEARVNTVPKVMLTVRGEGAPLMAWLQGRSEVVSAEMVREVGGFVTTRVTLSGDQVESLAEALVRAGFGLRRLTAAGSELEAAFLAVVGEGRV